MAKYIVEPKSRRDLRNLALILRKFFNLENEKYFPITELLDVFAEIYDNFSYEIVVDNELPSGTHADINTRTGHIRICNIVKQMDTFFKYKFIERQNYSCLSR